MDCGFFCFLSIAASLGLGDLSIIGTEGFSSIAGMTSGGETLEVVASDVATLELVASVG